MELNPLMAWRHADEKFVCSHARILRYFYHYCCLGKDCPLKFVGLLMGVDISAFWALLNEDAFFVEIPM
jgi:hypothetical protein